MANTDVGFRWRTLACAGVLLLAACSDDKPQGMAGEGGTEAGAGGTSSGSGGASGMSAGAAGITGGAAGITGGAGGMTGGAGGMTGGAGGMTGGAGGMTGGAGGMTGGAGGMAGTQAPDPCEDVEDPCTTEGVTCDGATLVVCEEDDDGCLVEVRTACTSLSTCGAGDQACNGCDATLATPACTLDPCRNAAGVAKANVCVVDETTCADDILVLCVDDADGCPIATQVDCTTAQTCGSSGEDACNVCDDGEPPACAFDPCQGVTDCLAEGASCRDIEVVECAPNEDGCLVETITDCTQEGEVSETCAPDVEVDGGDGEVGCAPCVPDPQCEGASSGERACDGNALETCVDANGDGCLDLVTEACGDDFTCQTDACVYTGDDGCADETAGGECCVERVLRESGSFGPFTTTDAGNEYGSYVCPGFNPSFPFVAGGRDLLFALDVAAGTATTVTLMVTSSSGTAPNLMVLTSCADQGTTLAERTCSALSRTTVSYANEGTTTTRVYLSVDADGANSTSTFGLEVNTHPIRCGDGLRDGSEACDDGNIFSNDGCTPACTLQEGYQCTDGNPSICTRRPTDGICGNVQCPALPSNAPDGTQTCCTTQQRCGVSNAFYYGASCIERDQPGVPDSECPNQAGRFLFLSPTLAGCCRPDNTCGLTAAAGAGCVERTAAWAGLADGFGAFLYNGPFAARSCTYDGP